MIVGGAQENTLLTVRGHMEHGHEVVLVTGPSEGPEGKLLQAQKIPGLKVEVIPHLVREVNLARDWLAYRELRSFLHRHRFDIVHTHSSKAGILGRMAAFHEHVPVVVHTVHGLAFHQYQTYLRNKFYITAEKMVAGKTDRIYAVANAMIDQCVEAGIAPRTKFKTVYSGMELENFLSAKPNDDLRRRLDLPPGIPVVGKIARLFELKGHEFLIQAAPHIIEEIGDVRFLLVGDGTLKVKLLEQIRALGLTEYFIFAGLVPPQEIPQYIALMDCLVHLSLREGLPRSVVQALACGKPAVGFALDGTPEVIHDGETGYLCAPESVLGVAAAVIKLLKDPQQAQQMGSRGREFVRERWDWRHMVDILEQDYLALLNRKRPAEQDHIEQPSADDQR